MYDDEELKDEEEVVTNPEEGDTNGGTNNDTTGSDTTEDNGGSQSNDNSDPGSSDPVEDDPVVNPDEPTNPEEPDEPEVDPADDPAVVVTFTNYTADKMRALASLASNLDDDTKIDMITSQVLNRVKANAAKGETELDVRYDSATIDFKEEFRTPVINKLTSLGYVVTENTKEDTAIGIHVVWTAE